MIKTRIKAFVVSAVIAAGLLGGTVTAYAADDGYNYMDAWNGIHGSDASDNNADMKVAERTGPQTEDKGQNTISNFEKEISVTEGDTDKNNKSADTVSGAGNLISGNAGNYISSDVKVGQNGTPDLNVDFSVNGGKNNNTGLFTPDGNLTLVDDLDTQESASLQYMTVQTKNGTTFYIIIDRTKDQENVYFLNPVDAADLMALMDDDTKAKYQTNTEAQAKSNNPNASATEKPEDAGKEDKAKDEEGRANPLGTLLIFVILGGGGAAAYYFFKIKPQKAKMKNDDDDLEFQDDEEYDLEKAEPDDAGEESDEEEDY